MNGERGHCCNPCTRTGSVEEEILPFSSFFRDSCLRKTPEDVYLYLLHCAGGAGKSLRMRNNAPPMDTSQYTSKHILHIYVIGKSAIVKRTKVKKFTRGRVVLTW